MEKMPAEEPVEAEEPAAPEHNFAVTAAFAASAAASSVAGRHSCLSVAAASKADGTRVNWDPAADRIRAQELVDTAAEPAAVGQEAVGAVAVLPAEPDRAVM